MGYVAGHGLQNPELKTLFQSDIEVPEICQSPGNQQLWQQLSFYFHFCQNQLPIGRLIIYA